MYGIITDNPTRTDKSAVKFNPTIEKIIAEAIATTMISINY